MKIINLNVEDGRGIISVAVEDEVDEARLRRFVKDSLEALEEKLEREIEAAA